MAVDEPVGLGLEHWDYEEHAHRHAIHYLQRYDLKKEYSITYDPRTHHRICKILAVTPPMPTLWGWTKDAKYIGKHPIGDHTYDQWALTISGVTLTVSVGETMPNRPYYYQRRSSTDHFEIHFIVWETRKPNATWFDVPAECKNGSAEIYEKEAPRDPMEPKDMCERAAFHATLLAKNQCVGPCEGLSGMGFVAKAFANAGMWVPSTMDLLYEGGRSCTDGINEGDLLFKGDRLMMSIGDGMGVECPIGGQCQIVPSNEFIHNCRRYC